MSASSGDPRADPLFAGSGEMAALLRAKDWFTTPLGPPAGWDRSLRTVVRIMLTSRYAMWMGWGPDLTFFYNDAYGPTLGAKHPGAVGQPAQQVWAEIWPAIGPRIDTVLQRGEATWDEGLLLFLERNGYPEETYHTFSYSPLPDDRGGIGGMLCVVTEETDRILGERRMAVLRDLAARLAATHATDEVFAAVERCLGGNSPDLPFSLTYLFQDDARRARLVSRTEIGADHPAAPDVIELGGAPSRWPLGEVLAQATEPVVAELDPGLVWPRGPWPRAPDRALLVPIAEQGQSRAAGVFIAGLNVHRPLDDAYRAFIRLFVGQLSAGFANARAHEAERSRATALTEIDRAKTIFFSNVSHEFRTPLTLMLGPIQDALAERERWSAEDVERWELLHRNGLRLAKLVNALLDFARIEAGRLEAAYEPTDLPALTRELTGAFRSAIEAAGLRLTVNVPQLPGPSYVDRDMWEKIVLNLLSNALKFTFRGEIAVALRADGDRVELTVADTGVGVPAAELPRLFERFYRVRGTESRTHEGTGIGLALVQELAHLHGGTVSATSAVGRGTTFAVRIPNGGPHLTRGRTAPGAALVSTAQGATAFVEEAKRWLPPRVPTIGSIGTGAAGPTAAGTSVEVRGDLPRLLLADDNADIRQYVSRILGDSWQVEAVADGEAALQAARTRRPDLVLSDVMMPKLDGFGLVRALREDPSTSDLPIILLSARAGEDATTEGLGRGANDYLVKPFSSRELIARAAAQLERARAQQIIKKSVETERRRLHSFLMEAPAAIAILRGPRLIFELVNERCYAIFGPREVTGKPAREALPELGPQGLWDLLDRVYETGEPFLATEFAARFQADLAGGPSDAERRFNWVAQPTHDETGRIDGVLVFAVEVTDQTTARRQVEVARANEHELRRAAEQGSRAKDEFLAMLGHELRNPLAPIVTALHLMRLRGDDRTLKERAVIERQVSHLTRLVDDLLDVSRITRGKIELKTKTIELSEAVARAIEMASPIVEQRQHRLTLNVPPHGLALRADPVRLAQVIANLLTNAAKYTEGKGTIAVGAAHEDGQVVLRVRDSGIGIAPAMLPRVFDLFAQEWQASDRSHGGLGLGLSIVRSLVNLHGGTVTAHSAGLGRGSEFVVRLPAAPEERAAVAPTAGPAATRTATTARKILVVEDNEDVAETLTELLEQLGHVVRVAHDGPAALQIPDTFIPDLALLDIGLPVMDGYELARRVRERRELRDVVLVALSGYGQESDRERSRQAGFVAHLVKPVDPDHLKQIIDELTAAARRGGAPP
ncbi:MAG TPA: ATP-binding protein [Polyangia bacterium]|nr:ATP-binding protein [Polyangia bacterium]